MIYKKIKILMVLAVFMLPIYRVSADSGGYIVKFNTDISKIHDISNFTEIADDKNIYSFNNLNDLKGLESYVEYYETNDKVDLIEGEETKDIECFSMNEFDTDSWQLDTINVKYAWDLATYGNGINVGVIDSGCNRHIDIIANLAGGHNYILNNDDFSDNVGHGTHVAGIIAAEDNEFGITGVAPKANIYALKCFDANYQTTVSMLAKAIYSAVDDYHCSIINMSLGLKTNRQTLYDAIKYAFDHNVIIVAAVGNDGNDTLYYPAAYEEVVGVGSIGATKEKSSFSQSNETVLVVAPGEECLSLTGENDYTVKSGTSQATPLVTGVAAILLSAKPNLTNTEFKEILKSCSDDLGEVGYDLQYGYGMLNTEKTMKSMLGEYYTSPITQGKITVFNNTDKELYAIGIWSEETDKGGLCVDINNIFVPPRQKTELKYKNEKVKFFLWDSLKTIKPLTIARKGEK